ncbi:PREDICTED: LOC110747605 partial, partial [Prunus dulcis]
CSPETILNALFHMLQRQFRPRKSSKAFQKPYDPLQSRRRANVKVFAMTLREAAQDWFHTLSSGSINSFKELTYVFTKEYTSYRTIKKNPDHLFNLRKKPEESLRDYIKRFKAEKANIVGCDDQIASSAFKKGLPAEHDLYRELTITPSQTLAEVFATAERYALWDEDRIAAKKSTEQEDRPAKRAEQRSDRLGSRDKDK